MLMTLVVVGLAGSAIASAVFSAFSATTTNVDNTISAGTVAISDNDAAATMYAVTNAAPGVITKKCIQVTYDGSLNSAVKLYTDSTLDASAQYINLKITSGTQGTPAMDCTGFAADTAGVIYNDDMTAFATAHNGWSNGLALTNQSNVATWATDDAVVYQFEVNVVDTPAAQGATSDLHTFTWEAQNS
jgi:hypothetical protein